MKFKFYQTWIKQLIVPNKNSRHTIQVTKDRPVYIVIDQW